MQKPKATNWIGIGFWGVLLGLAAIVVFYFYREPIVAFFNSLPSRISNFQMPDFTNLIQNFTLDNVLTFIQKYGVLITGAAATFSFIYGLYKNAQTNKALQELAATKQAADEQITSIYSSAQSSQQQADYYKDKYAELAKSGGHDALIESQNLVAQKEQTIKNLQSRIEVFQYATYPTENDMISKLRYLGYNVEKKVPSVP